MPGTTISSPPKPLIMNLKGGNNFGSRTVSGRHFLNAIMAAGLVISKIR